MKTITVHTDEELGIISRHIFGHFSEHLGRCIYDGYWVGDDSGVPNVRGIRTDIVDALAAIGAPVIRWPGGCFADDYHWRDGIGPRDERPPMVNTHWGRVVENNHFGTHEFLDLCEQVGAEPYICGNVGSGSVREMRDWVEYITGSPESAMGRLRAENGRVEPWPLTYFGIGNENWGCGGNMRPEHYADLYRQYAGYVRQSGGPGIYRIACGSHDSYFDWTEVLMSRAAQHFEGLSYHYYTGLPKEAGVSRSAVDFGEHEWFLTMRRAFEIEATLSRHMTIMDRHDPKRSIGMIVDEWGTWHEVEPGTNPGFLYQQNTVRDALVAAYHLNLFGTHCGRIRMANLAQTVNVLQAVLLTDGERLIRTPTWHVFDLYRRHHDATLLRSHVERGQYQFGDEYVPAVSALCSRDEVGGITVTIANLHPTEGSDVEISLYGKKAPAAPEILARILTSDTMQRHNTSDEPDAVAPTELTGVHRGTNGPRIEVPPMSVIAVSIHDSGDSDE